MNKKSEIKNKINEWLESQGYPLEMNVATQLRNAGFDVQISHYYTDPENETIREIDIVATYPEYTGCLDISFVIECKVSKKKPWLLFSTKHTLENFNRLFAFCIHSHSARTALVDKGIETFIKLPRMKKEGRTAYGITQAFTSGEDTTFKATTSALKAAISRKQTLNKQNLEPFIFVFPTIIVDGDLFECYLNDDGKMTVESLKEMDYFFPWCIGEEIGTCIRIFTFDNISAFVTEAKSVAEALSTLLENDTKIKLDSIAGIFPLRSIISDQNVLRK